MPVTVFAGPDALRLALRLQSPGDCVVASNWNGPGSVLIEPDVAHRTRECPCCAIRLDLVDGLLRAVRRRRRPRRILLVADPNDDLTTMTYTLLSDADLARHVRLDGVVMAVDAVAAATRIAAPGLLGNELELDALAVADVIVLGRSGELTTDGFGRLVSALRDVNQVGHVCAPALSLRGDDRPDDDVVMGLDAWHGAPTLSAAIPSVSRRDRDDVPDTVVLRQAAPLDPDAIDEWLTWLVDTHARRLLRMQGALAVVSASARVCCHGVRSFAMSHSEAADPVTSRCNDSLVIVVGHGLDVDDLSSGFAATRAR